MQSTGYLLGGIFTHPGEIGAHGMNHGRINGDESEPAEVVRDADGITIDPNYTPKQILEHRIVDYCSKTRRR